MTSLALANYPETERISMLDLLFVIVGLLFFLACWSFTKACDRL